MILRGEVLSPDVYGRLRGGVRAAIAAESRVRRVVVCPGLHLYFESRHSLWFHLHELLHATTWDECAIAEELAQINRLIPADFGLVATAASEDDGQSGQPSPIGGAWSLRLCGQSVRATDLSGQDGAAPCSRMRHLFFPVDRVQGLLLNVPGLDVDVCVKSGGTMHCVALSEACKEVVCADLGVHSRVQAC